MNNGKQTYDLSNHESNRAAGGRALPTASWRGFAAKAAGVAAVVAVTAVIAHTLLRTPPASAQMSNPPLLLPQLGSPPFANPPEMQSSGGRLRGVMQIVSGEFMIPNLGQRKMRQYRGWPLAAPTPTPPAPGTIPNVSPGPTLRARLGDQVQISFLNKANRDLFPYTLVTDSKPGYSDFGCDKVGTRNALTKQFEIYPGNDKFPNCFHGSNTANIHYHGTHTSPDGTGDNVLVQVMPDPRQPDNWQTLFNKMFDTGKIPQKWADLPLAFRNDQINMVKRQDAVDSEEAIRNGLRPPDSLAKKNQELISAGRWPQYFVGAFPNFFDLPDYSSGKYKAGQAPGTHWYHAHKHGSTSLHIRHGLAGAFVIESSQEGGYDHFIRKFYGWGNTYGEHEKIFVFQQYDPEQNLERGPGTGLGKGSNMILVNGQMTPTITMRPGEVQLWRFVNATEGNATGVVNAGTTDSGLFQTSKFNFRQTAQDGVQFSPANYKAQPYLEGEGGLPGLILAAGNRADLLVQAPSTPSGRVPFKSGNAILFYVEVAGPAVSLPKAFPDTWAELPPFLKDLPKPAPEDSTNKIRFQWEPGRAKPGRNAANDPPHFMINDKQFAQDGEDKVDQCMPQDGLQEWTLENYTSVIAHPFHIHINPFQVIRIEDPVNKKTYAPQDNFIWQDVIAVPPAVINTDASGNITSVVPGRVTIRQTYLDFPGTFVLHCHILAHEDRGMMQLVRVVPAANYPKDCQVAVPRHH